VRSAHDPEVLFSMSHLGWIPCPGASLSLINDFARRGTAILCTIHYLEKAEHVQRSCFDGGPAK